MIALKKLMNKERKIDMSRKNNKANSDAKLLRQVVGNSTKNKKTTIKDLFNESDGLSASFAGIDLNLNFQKIGEFSDKVTDYKKAKRLEELYDNDFDSDEDEDDYKYNEDQVDE